MKIIRLLCLKALEKPNHPTEKDKKPNTKVIILFTLTEKYYN